MTVVTPSAFGVAGLQSWRWPALLAAISVLMLWSLACRDPVVKESSAPDPTMHNTVSTVPATRDASSALIATAPATATLTQGAAPAERRDPALTGAKLPSTRRPQPSPNPTPTPVPTPTSGQTAAGIPPHERMAESQPQREPPAVAGLPENVLNPVLWLGCQTSDNVYPAGSGVVVKVDGAEYLVTALHVVENCGREPRLRFDGQWHPAQWQTVVVDESHDVAVLKTAAILDHESLPILYGHAGIQYGQIGYSLGFPQVLGKGRISRTDHIFENEGRPVPIAALALANFKFTGEAVYIASYVNQGFSGGAVVFPHPDGGWTIAGIMTHIATLPTAVYQDGKKIGETAQPTGLVGYAPLEIVQDLITNAQAAQGPISD